jgi:hypothetical protein
MKIGTFLGGAIVVACLAVGSAKGAPLLTLELLGSTSSSGPFTSSVTATSGSTVYYEVSALFSSGATNTNTSHSPNGTADAINSLPSFSFTDGTSASFAAGATMDNNFGSGTGSGVTVSGTGSDSITVRAVNASGVYANADTLLEIANGTMTVNSTTPATIAGAFVSTSGLLHVGGTNLVSVTSTTEGGSDPILKYQSLQLNPAASATILSATTSSPAGFGSSLGSIAITGGSGSYKAGVVTFAGTSSGFVSVSTFNPTSDIEVYGLDVKGATQTQLNQIVTDIGSNASLTWTSVVPAGPNTIAPLFTDGGTPVYFGETLGAASPFIGFNLANDSTLSGVTITGVAAVPEPATVGLLGVGSLALLARRRRRD